MSKRIHARPFYRRALRTILASALLASLSLVALPTPAASAGGSSHPYFNDRGALRWYTRHADAVRAAKQQNKLILVEAGRKRCAMCKRLCTTVLPNRAIRGRVSRIAVGLVGNADHPEAAIQHTLHTRFVGARMLPLVWFMTPDGTYIAGFWGKRTVQQFARDLDLAEAAWRRMRQPKHQPPRCGLKVRAPPSARRSRSPPPRPRLSRATSLKPNVITTMTRWQTSAAVKTSALAATATCRRPSEAPLKPTRRLPRPKRQPRSPPALRPP